VNVRTAVSISAVLSLVLLIAGCGASVPTSGVGTVAPASTTAPSTSLAVKSLAPATLSPSTSPTPGATPTPVVVAAVAPGPALKVGWQSGGPKRSSDGGCCVTVAPDGSIWVSTESDSTFWIFDPTGKFRESWGTPGSADGQFDFVVGPDGWGDVAFDPDGTFYVADTGNHRIQKFDKGRRFVKAWGGFGTGDGQFATPAWIASDGHGHVYVADADRYDVQEFSSDGAFLRTVVTGETVYFVETDPKGHLYIDDGPTILVFDADGQQLPGLDLSSTGAWAAGMAFAPNGHLFVATVRSYVSPQKIMPTYELDASGKVVHAWPGVGDSLAFDRSGQALYVSWFADPFIRSLELPKP
jgi:sugar lactone lactonase YvrE